MKKIYLLAILLYLSSEFYGQAWEWAKQPPSLTDSVNNIHIAVDALGNSFLASSKSLYGQAIAAHIVKSFPDGTPVWDINLGKKISINGLAPDLSGNLFVSGVFSDTINIGGSYYYSQGGFDAIIMKIDPAGTVMWIKILKSVSNDFSNDIRISASGTLLVTGSVGNNGTIGTNTYTAGGFFLAEYSLSGTLLNVARSTKGGEGKFIRTDGSGNIYISGSVPDTLILGTDTLHTFYGSLYFIARFTSSFTLIWNKAAGGGPYLETDVNGNSYLTYYYWTYFPIGIEKYDASGNLKWKKWLSSAEGFPNSTATDPNGLVIVAGGSYYYGDTVSTFLWKVDSTSAIKDYVVSAPHEFFSLYSIATGADGSLYVCGRFPGDSIHLGNILLHKDPGQGYFFAKINDALPKALPFVSQPYEAQNAYAWQNSYNATNIKWECPGGVPSVSYDSSLFVHYALPGNYTVRLIASNNNGSDTVSGNVTINAPVQIDEGLKKYSYYNNGSLESLKKVPDGFIAMGNGNLFKFDGLANLEWVSSFDMGYYPLDMTSINDGYVTLSRAQSPQNTFLRKTNKQGKLLWSKQYKDSLYGSTSGMSLCATDDGGFLFNGIGLVKCDASGNVKWQKKYNSFIENITRKNSNAYLINGFVYIGSVGKMWLAEVDSLGNVNWMKQYDGINSYQTYNLITASNGDILIHGQEGGTNWSNYLVRTDGTGNVKWCKTYAHDTAWMMKMTETDNGHLFFTGEKKWSGMIMELDDSGNFIRALISDSLKISNYVAIAALDSNDIISGFMGEGKTAIYKMKTGGQHCITDTIMWSQTTRIISTPAINANVTALHISVTDLSYNPSRLVMPVHTTTDCPGSIVTAITNINVEKNILIYPNPNDGHFAIETGELSGKVNIAVYSVLGKRVLFKQSMPAASIQVDLSAQPKGIYFVQIVADGKRTVKKIVLE